MALNYGNANAAQRNAISTTNGPVLITAGPGTGKTFTLVQRAIYLIEECGILPEQGIVWHLFIKQKSYRKMYGI